MWAFIEKVKPDQSTTNEQSKREEKTCVGLTLRAQPRAPLLPMGLVVTPPPSVFVAASLSSRLHGLLHVTPPHASLGSPVPLVLAVLWGPQCLPSWAEALPGQRSFSAFLSSGRVIAPPPRPPPGPNEPLSLPPSFVRPSSALPWYTS